jgi:hypothetical protein
MDTHNLPDDALILIIQFCDVKTIKAFRLTCRSVLGLLHRYEKSLCAIVGKRCFDEEVIQLFKYHSSIDLDLKSIFGIETRLRQSYELARRLVQANLEAWNIEPLAASESISDQAEEYTARGFAILWSLADIAKEVTDENFSTTKSNIESSQPLYTKVMYDRWDRYVKTLTFRERWYYGVLHRYMRVAFRGRVFEDPQKDWYEIGLGNAFDDRDSWIAWPVFCRGPKLFLQAWSGPDGHQACTDYIYDQWVCKSYNERLWEYRAGREIEASLEGQGRNYVRTDWIGRDLLGPYQERSSLGSGKRTECGLGYEVSAKKEREWDLMWDHGDPEDYPPQLRFVQPTRGQIRVRDGDPLTSGGLDKSEWEQTHKSYQRFNNIIPPRILDSSSFEYEYPQGAVIKVNAVNTMRHD